MWNVDEVVREIVKAFPHLKEDEVRKKHDELFNATLTEGIARMVFWAVGLELQRKMSR